MNQKEESQLEYEEIDLMDYVKVILKRKRQILNVFLIVVIVVGVFGWLSPKVYKIDTSLEIGKIGNEIVEEPSQVVEKIEGDVYGILVREKLGISEKDYPEIQVENPEKTNLIKISIESAEAQKSQNILEGINNLILTEHQGELEKKKSKIQENIKEIQEELTLLETEKVYSDEGIAQLQIELLKLKELINNAESSRIVKMPTLSERPVRPKFLLNIVIAGALGLFLGVFWAFSQEWWEKNKIKL